MARQTSARSSERRGRHLLGSIMVSLSSSAREGRSRQRWTLPIIVADQPFWIRPAIAGACASRSVHCPIPYCSQPRSQRPGGTLSVVEVQPLRHTSTGYAPAMSAISQPVFGRGRGPGTARRMSRGWRLKREGEAGDAAPVRVDRDRQPGRWIGCRVAVDRHASISVWSIWISAHGGASATSRSRGRTDPARPAASLAKNFAPRQNPLSARMVRPRLARSSPGQARWKPSRSAGGSR